SLAALWAVLESETPLPHDERRIAAGLMVSAGVPLRRLPLTWRLPPPPSMRVAPAAEAQRGTEPVEFDWVRETARQIGTVAHRLLRQIAEDGLDSWTLARVEAQQQRVARDLTALGFTGAEAAAAGEQVLASIRTMLAEPRGPWRV